MVGRWLMTFGLTAIVLTGCTGAGTASVDAEPAAAISAAKPGPTDAVEQMFEALNASKAAPPKTSKSEAKPAVKRAEAAREPQVFEAPVDPPAGTARPSAQSVVAAADKPIEPVLPPEEASIQVIPAQEPPRPAVSKPTPSAAASLTVPSQPPTTTAPAESQSLKITSLMTCSRIEAYGRYTAMDLSRVPMGRAVPMLLYTEVEGFAHRSAAGLPPPPGADALSDDGSTEWVVHLTQKITIRRNDQAGTLVKLYEEQAARDVARRRRRDHYLVQRIILPATLAPGAYVITAEVLDTATGQAAQKQVPITVIGR